MAMRLGPKVDRLRQQEFPCGYPSRWAGMCPVEHCSLARGRCSTIRSVERIARVAGTCRLMLMLMLMPMEARVSSPSRMSIAGISHVNGLFLYRVSSLCTSWAGVDAVAVIDAAADRESFDNLDAHGH